MKLVVELLAFDDEESFRPVEIPDREYEEEEAILEEAFHYGQNDFQPREMPSVSSGDVIHYNNNKYLIQDIGFKKLTEEKYEKYKSWSSRDRIFRKKEL